MPYFPPNQASETALSILAKLLTVDGSESGLDADTLDGLHASELGGGGVSDHGLLTGLSDNDHPQYYLASNVSSYAATLLLAADAATARTVLGLSSMAVATEANYLLVDGTRNSTGTQQFTAGVKTGIIRAITDSATAIQLQNASGTAVVTVDTTNSIVKLPSKIDANNIRIAYVPGGNFTGTMYFGTGGSALSHVSGFDGQFNIAVGVQALFLTTIGNSNAAIGYQAMRSNTTGSSNMSIGYQAMYSNIGGGSNVAIGSQALFYNTTGSSNMAIGYQALFRTTTSNNVAIGTNALRENTTGLNNSAIGTQAIYLSQSGTSCVGIGYQSLFNNNGSNNIGIGVQSLYTNTTGSGLVAIGYQSGYSETGSNKLYIANTSTATPLIYGDFSNGILKFHSTINTDAITNTLSLVKRRSSGLAGVGLGVALRAGLHSSTTEDQDAGRLMWQWATAIHDTRASRGNLTAYYMNTEQIAITWDGNSAGIKLGFYGSTPVSKQVVPTGSTVDTLITALQDLGLISQS